MQKGCEQADNLEKGKGKFLLELRIVTASESWEAGSVNSQVDKPGATNSEHCCLQ